MASTNTNNTARLVALGAIKTMVNLLQEVSTRISKEAGGVMRTRVIESTIWALGNIAGDGISHRDAVNDENAHDVIQKIVRTGSETLSVLRISIWALSNFPRGGRFPRKLLSLAHFAVQLLRLSDRECHVDALWLLSYLSDGPDTNQTFIASVAGLPMLLLKFLRVSEPIELLTPALRAAGNLLTGPDDITSIVIDAGVIPALMPLLTYHRMGIRKEACWAFSNILGGIPSQITACLDAGAHKALLELIYDPGTQVDISKEACWAITNAIVGANSEDFRRLAGSPFFIKAFADCLVHHDNALLQIAMTGVDKVLAYGQLLGETQDANYRSSIECDVAPANPFLDYLYAECSDVLDDDGEPISFDVLKLAHALHNVGNGFRVEIPEN